jgi:hypothetical protein
VLLRGLFVRDFVVVVVVMVVVIRVFRKSQVIDILRLFVHVLGLFQEIIMGCKMMMMNPSCTYFKVVRPCFRVGCSRDHHGCKMMMMIHPSSYGTRCTGMCF